MKRLWIFLAIIISVGLFMLACQKKDHPNIAEEYSFDVEKFAAFEEAALLHSMTLDAFYREVLPQQETLLRIRNNEYTLAELNSFCETKVVQFENENKLLSKLEVHNVFSENSTRSSISSVNGVMTVSKEVVGFVEINR